MRLAHLKSKIRERKEVLLNPSQFDRMDKLIKQQLFKPRYKTTKNKLQVVFTKSKVKEPNYPKLTSLGRIKKKQQIIHINLDN
tara:strand:+ start:479 stop:727 length:249 start_codon:yes stop_codon:yes gene_type:complete